MTRHPFSHQTGVVGPPLTLRGHCGQQRIVQTGLELIGIAAIARKTQHLVEELHPCCRYTSLHTLIHRLGLTHLSVTPDLHHRSRTHDHDLIADDRIDQLVTSLEIERISRNTVHFTQTLEARHHLIGLRCPTHLPQRSTRKSLLYQTNTGRGQLVGRIPRFDDVFGKLQIASITGFLIQQGDRLEHR